ncbi:hypothetical protein HYDPIDRAFT_46993, partial [Hydnomerulius pinastri MD-312]
QVVFKGNRIYSHPLLRINYTTYNLHREMDTVNPRTDHHDIMLLAHAGGPERHPFCYAHILAIYHANVVFTRPESRDYQARRFEFLWVRWFQLLDTPAGWEHSSLDKERFMSMDQADVYGFVDPSDVLRCCHLVLVFADGRLHPDGVAISRNARDSDDWKYYYINRFIDRDMLMRYHWGLGVGHTY